jgi:hypothetical protein
MQISLCANVFNLLNFAGTGRRYSDLGGALTKRNF